MLKRWPQAEYFHRSWDLECSKKLSRHLRWRTSCITFLLHLDDECWGDTLSPTKQWVWWNIFVPWWPSHARRVKKLRTCLISFGRSHMMRCWTASYFYASFQLPQLHEHWNSISECFTGVHIMLGLHFEASGATIHVFLDLFPRLTLFRLLLEAIQHTLAGRSLPTMIGGSYRRVRSRYRWTWWWRVVTISEWKSALKLLSGKTRGRPGLPTRRNEWTSGKRSVSCISLVLRCLFGW